MQEEESSQGVREERVKGQAEGEPGESWVLEDSGPPARGCPTVKKGEDRGD